jgi:outer membrane protein OmpA-like peptidoglycan-associated protein
MDTMVAYSIQAHTDDVGSTEYNDELSNQRGNSVLSYLHLKGVPSENIKAKYHGELMPIASNESEDGRQKNRRATIRKYHVKEMQWITGVLKDSVNQVGIEASIKLHSRTIQTETTSDSTGFFRIAGPAGEVVGLDVRAKGYLLHTHMMKVTPLSAKKPVKLYVPKIEIGKSIRLSKLFFEGNKDILVEKSLEVMDELYLFMSENSEMCVEISGHTNLPNEDPVDKESWNYYLSVARAKKINDILIGKNIVKSRMNYKGFGNWKMLYPKATTESQAAKNRRVELKIIECDKVSSAFNDKVPPDLDFSTGLRQIKSTKVN